VLNAKTNKDNFIPKYQAIASIIYNQKYDIIGLTELDSMEFSKKVVDYLNEIERKNHTGNV